jgi:hypothetical protein
LILVVEPAQGTDDISDIGTDAEVGYTPNIDGYFHATDLIIGN